MVTYPILYLMILRKHTAYSERDQIRDTHSEAVVMGCVYSRVIFIDYEKRSTRRLSSEMDVKGFAFVRNKGLENDDPGILKSICL